MTEDVRQWLLKALEDLKIAEHELSFPPEEQATGPVCFHCQQTAEKLFKAYMVFNGKDFPKTHDLEHLLELCARIAPDFKSLDLGNLTDYAIEVRYPDEFYTPTAGEAKESFKLTVKIKKFVFKELGVTKRDILRKKR